MMNSEAKFNSWIQGLFPHPADCRRIETTTESGMPDLNVCMHGIEIWIESKVVYPKGILIRKEQWAWGVRRSNAGGTTYLLAWDEQDDMVLGWRLEGLTVHPSGDMKTLVVQNRAEFKHSKNDKDCRRSLLKFLFPMV